MNRLVRTIIGLLLLALIAASYLGFVSLGGTIFTVALAFLGLSLVLQGLMAMPGCEIMAIPNLLMKPWRRRIDIPCIADPSTWRTGFRYHKDWAAKAE